MTVFDQDEHEDAGIGSLTMEEIERLREWRYQHWADASKHPVRDALLLYAGAGGVIFLCFYGAYGVAVRVAGWFS